MILLLVTCFFNVGDGPFWFSTIHPEVARCEKYWFSNLLYFNNLFPLGRVNDEVSDYILSNFIVVMSFHDVLAFVSYN